VTILFKPRHVPLILDGRKTHTRRIWKRNRVKVGGEYWASTALFDKSKRFARLKVLATWRENLGDITQEDVVKEGYAFGSEFLEAFGSINGVEPDLFQEVTVVEFEVVR